MSLFLCEKRQGLRSVVTRSAYLNSSTKLLCLIKSIKSLKVTRVGMREKTVTLDFMYSCLMRSTSKEKTHLQLERCGLGSFIFWSLNKSISSSSEEQESSTNVTLLKVYLGV